jgi:hypothetical protein
VGEFVPPLPEWLAGPEPPFRTVEELRIGDQSFHPWQEAQEREIELAGVALGELLTRPRSQTFTVPGRRWLEPLPGPGGQVVGVLVREQQAIEGSIEAEAVQAEDALFKVTLRVMNHTPVDESGRVSRDDALVRSLVSTHTVLGISAGEFVSLLDPPEVWRAAAADCHKSAPGRGPTMGRGDSARCFGITGTSTPARDNSRN